MTDHPGYDPTSPIKPGQPMAHSFHIEMGATSLGTFTIPIPVTGSNLTIEPIESDDE